MTATYIQPTLAAFLLAPLWAWLALACVRSITTDLAQPRAVHRPWRIIP